MAGKIQKNQQKMAGTNLKNATQQKTGKKIQEFQKKMMGKIRKIKIKGWRENFFEKWREKIQKIQKNGGKKY